MVAQRKMLESLFGAPFEGGQSLDSMSEATGPTVAQARGRQEAGPGPVARVIQLTVNAQQLMDYLSSGNFQRDVEAKERTTGTSRDSMRFAKVASGELNNIPWLDLNQVVEWVVPLGRQDLPREVVNNFRLKDTERTQ